MIRNETEYQEAVRRLDEERTRLVAHEAKLKEMGLTSDEITHALDPLRSFHLQLAEEVESYERLKRGDLGELVNLHGLGRTLVALRIALGLTQRELAERLNVHESQVSRDERNEYHGITVDRVTRILDALQVDLTSRFQEPLLPFNSVPRWATPASTEPAEPPASTRLPASTPAPPLSGRSA